jgi:hypothetical protein
MVLGDFIDDIIRLIKEGTPREKVVQTIDQKFLWGAWGDIVGEIPNMFFIADLRGVIYDACAKAAGHD